MQPNEGSSGTGRGRFEGIYHFSFSFHPKSYFTSLLTNFFLSIETNKKFYQQLEQIKKDSQRINEIFQDISN